MQFNYQEALNVIREKHISWVEYFFRNYGVDISNAITSYQDHLALVVNNVDDNILKLEDYITGIARRIEGAQESLKISIGSNCANMISNANKTAEFTVDEDVTDPIAFINTVISNTKKATDSDVSQLDNQITLDVTYYPIDEISQVTLPTCDQVEVIRNNIKLKLYAEELRPRDMVISHNGKITLFMVNYILCINISSAGTASLNKANKSLDITIGESGVDPVKFIKDAMNQFNATKAESDLTPKISVLVEHLNVTHGDNTETCVFDETEVLTVFTKTGIVCKGVMYLEPGDILVGRKYVSKVKQIHK